MLESFESCSASVTIHMPFQKQRPLTSSTSFIFIKRSAISMAIWHTQTVILQQHNGYCLCALTNKPLFFFFLSISEHRLLERGKGKEESQLEMDQTRYYFTIFSLLPSSSHSSRGFCCLFRHRGSSQDVVFVLWLETKNGNMTFVNKAELKYQWHKSIYPLYYSTDLKAYFCFRRNSITIWCFAN